MRTKEFYAGLISNADNCKVEVLSMAEVENGVFVTFRFGEFDEESAAVIYDDNTIFTPRDWQSGDQPKSVEDIERVDWIEFESKRDAVIVNGLPRLF